MWLVCCAACCGAIAFVLGVLFGVVPTILGLLGDGLVFGVIMAPLVSKYVHPLFMV